MHMSIEKEMWQGGISNWREEQLENRRSRRFLGMMFVIIGAGLVFYGLMQNYYFKPRINQVDQMQRVSVINMDLLTK